MTNDMTKRRVVILMARAPEHGRVKTRLAATIGADEALAAYRHLAEHTVRCLREFARRRGNIRLGIACTPDSAGPLMADWLGHDLAVTPQGEGDLGARMERVVLATLEGGAEQVFLVGTDCPYLTPTLLEEAMVQLDTHEVVMGPTEDGGYYLAGLAARRAGEVIGALFRGIPWSSPDTFARTLAALDRIGARVGRLPRLADIDTADDWWSWQGHAARPPRG